MVDCFINTLVAFQKALGLGGSISLKNLNFALLRILVVSFYSNAQVYHFSLHIALSDNALFLSWIPLMMSLLNQGN